ncbi:MAG: metal ABC transporter ATP-binding protein [Thermoguttaceae bacterium]|nr:metal ABC transporter ATP-binding protein [Thermoguttaceae bacterium]MBR5758258.1 metal ABC transporter ATP-binding protein [Thermoguttaceae bacterium]
MIQLDNVSYSYGPDSEPAVRDVTLTIPRGEFVSIVGPNGGGKSTLLKLILGLLKPQTGRILLFGETPEKSRYKVGYAPQQARVDFNFPISVLDVTLAGRFGVPGDVGPRRRRFFPRFTKQDKEEALAALDKMQVADLARKSFGDLSGGQRQRVLIARALCSNPELLALDEPTNNIDPANAERFYELLAGINKKSSVLIVSHDLGVVSKLVDSVVCVNQEVRIHPTSEFDGKLVSELYNADVRLVRHDHRCSEHGHVHTSDAEN